MQVLKDHPLDRYISATSRTRQVSTSLHSVDHLSAHCLPSTVHRLLLPFSQFVNISKAHPFAQPPPSTHFSEKCLTICFTATFALPKTPLHSSKCLKRLWRPCLTFPSPKNANTFICTADQVSMLKPGTKTLRHQLPLRGLP